jgi:hypothetical protein
LSTSSTGTGRNYTVDFTFPQPEPPPVTTIAWRLAHIIVGCLELVLHIHREVIHHGAEVALLRDLYRQRG